MQEGATVYGLARNKEKLEGLRKMLGEKFIPVSMDISDFGKVKSWVSHLFSSELIPDILINNAGVGSFGKIDEMPFEKWLEMMNTNLSGVYNLTSEIVKWMKKKEESSHIINIGSILGKTTRAEAAAYCTTKYGINGMSEVLFKELRGDNIKVTCLNAGSIDTDFFQSSGINAHSNMLQPEDIADSITYLLETPDNMLINELTIRPLNPKKPKE